MTKGGTITKAFMNDGICANRQIVAGIAHGSGAPAVIEASSGVAPASSHALDEAFVQVEAETRAIQGSKHVAELQSLRGLAATAVLVHHVTFFIALTPGLRRGAEIAFNAHAAVVLFFVLSGFVLSVALTRRPVTLASVAGFYVQRGFRIYPALWIACMLAVASVFVARGIALPVWVHPGFRTAYAEVADHPLRWLPAFAALAFTLPLPMWSLFVELVGSLLMPLIAVATRRPAALAAVVLMLVAVGAAVAGARGPIGFAAYLPCFTGGAFVYRWRERVADMLASNRRALSLAAVGFVLLWFGRLVAGSAWAFDRSYHSYPATLLETVGAALLIAAIVARPVAFAPLRHSVLLWLGDVSYSLYLVHVPLMVLLAGLAASTVRPAPALAALVVLLPLLAILAASLAHIVYRWIEVLAIRIGRWVSADVERLVDHLYTGALRR